MEKTFAKPRVYLRRITVSRKKHAGEDMTIWIWVGANPVGQDWSLGSAGLYSLAEAIKTYKRKLRQAGVSPEALQ